MAIGKIYKCQFCGKTFKRRTWFEKHMCEKKRRFLAANDIDVMRAHRVYNHWQRRSGMVRRGKGKTMEQFQNSHFYKAFVDLVKFTESKAMFSPFKYIDWIIDKGIREYQWYDDANVDQFQAYLREVENPSVQAEETKRFIERYCEETGTDPKTFFEDISVSRAIEMVKNNQIAPWVLFGYDESIEKLCGRIHGENYAILDEVVSIDRWARKIEGNPKGCDLVEEIMAGL